MSSSALTPDRLRSAVRIESEFRRANRTATRLARISRVVAWLSWMNLAAVVGAFVLLCVVSERWWVSAALTYLPRAPYLIPAGVLLVAALVIRRGVAWVNLLSLIIVAGPLMGLSVPTNSSQAATASGPTLRVLSCNVQNGLSSLPRLLVEIDRVEADVLVLQETQTGVEDLEDYLKDWHNVHVGELWVASKSPVKLISECHVHSFDRRSAILCEVETEFGPVLIGSVHLNTPRYGLTELRWHSLLSDAGVDEFKEFQLQRAYEMKETRTWLNETTNGRPFLLAGDFNTPTTSSLFAPVWGDLTSGFEAAATGYGFTAPCQTRIWPSNTPWVRIDHLLCSKDWSVAQFEIGHTNGSDHRLIWADLSLQSQSE
jgi:endonuclease/exonuclease/phosphatase family metal-dependent hydrolase